MKLLVILFLLKLYTRINIFRTLIAFALSNTSSILLRQTISAPDEALPKKCIKKWNWLHVKLIVRGAESYRIKKKRKSRESNNNKKKTERK